MKRIIWLTLASLLVAALLVVFFVIKPVLYSPNIALKGDKKEQYIYIRTGSSFADVQRMFEKQGIMKDTLGFGYLSRYMKYDTQIKPGRYRVNNGMTNLSLIRMLRAGQQVPVDLVFRDMRFEEDIAALIGKNLEADSAEVIKLLNDDKFLSTLNLGRKEKMVMFIANTYRFNWNTNAKETLERLQKEYLKVWDDERKKEASAINLTEAEVVTLASIVQEEVYHRDEAPKVAGAYLNRLKIGMKLQADPTVKYVKLMDDPSLVIRRLYYKDLKLQSEYNTYIVKGLPPGPIIVPDLWAIDAVLNADAHKYLFFVADTDPGRAGYHYFTETFGEHQKHARQYTKRVDERGIK